MSIKLAGMFLAGVVVGASVVAIANIGNVECCYIKNKKRTTEPESNSKSDEMTESVITETKDNDESETEIKDEE